MSADKAQLLGLIGLRALAERDPIEYRRVADLAIPELDRRIEALLPSVQDEECSLLYKQAIEISSQPDADMILGDVAESSSRKAQIEAMKSAMDGDSLEDSEFELPRRNSGTPLSNPGAIIDEEMNRANLEWADPVHAELMPFKSDADILKGGTFLAALGSVLDSLSNPDVVVGSDSSRQSAAWMICERILQSKGMVLKMKKSKASKRKLLSAAQQGESSDWLQENVEQAARTSKTQ